MNVAAAQARWQATVDGVADAMRVFTRQFVTPLSLENPQTVRLSGTGTYVMLPARSRIVLTCEHVSRLKPVDYRFYGSNDVFRHPGPWREDPDPVDAGVAEISDVQWGATSHSAGEVSIASFAFRHLVADPAELLFFRGFAGQNAAFAWNTHQTNSSGYCSQEVTGAGDSEIFEMFWEPQQTQFTAETPDDVRAAMRFNDPQGFSGSLVWNTRYREVTAGGGNWSTADAVVTGLLRRWDTKTKTLLVWRVEHLRQWLGV